jgi:hypothetical protein
MEEGRPLRSEDGRIMAGTGKSEVRDPRSEVGRRKLKAEDPG